MKVKIDSDEEYPVYSISADLTDWGKEIEIDESLYEEYKQIMKKYNEVQAKLRVLFGEVDD